MPNNVTTMGKHLLQKAFPKEYPYKDQILDKKGAFAVFSDLATKHPDLYVDTLNRLNQLSTVVSTERGDEASLSLDDLILPPELEEYRNNLHKDISKIAQNPSLSMQDKNDRIVKYLSSKIMRMHDEIREGALKHDNKFAKAIKHGFRGSPTQFTQLVFGDLLVLDHMGRPIPIPGLHGYGEGVTPMEYWAASYGARKGLVDVQAATAATGYFGKRLALSTNDIKVTSKDCGAENIGLLREGSDSDNIGSVLARDEGPYKAGTIITSKMLPELEGKNVLLRSASTCQQHNGVCQLCVGKRETGELPEIGEYIGIHAARVTSEPLTQSGLCLTKDTEVRLSDGSVKEIQYIKQGDWVLGADKDGNTFPVQVLDVFNNGPREVNKYSFRMGSSNKNRIHITCTPNHKILGCRVEQKKNTKHLSMLPRVLPISEFSGGFRRYAVLPYGTFHEGNPGGTNITLANSYRCRWVETIPAGVVDTMDIEVDHPDHLFVLANGMIVSNSSKHTGGAMGATNELSGFDAVEQFVNVPKNFVGKSILAPKDGKVSNIYKAPQGGHYIFINGEQLHAPQHVDLQVKVGDTVEAGDVLTTGTPNPAEIAEYKGLGEGRKYFVERFYKMLRDNGVSTHKRNLEVIARGFFNKVKVTSPDGVAGFEIDESIPYSAIQKNYKPRPGSTNSRVSRTVSGQYLEKPVLHYTIGTRLTPKVLDNIKAQKIDEITVHKDPPGFEPQVVRLLDIVSTDPNWKTRLAGFGLKGAFLDSAQKGSEAPHDSSSFVGGLMDVNRL